MPLSINTNVASLGAQRNLAKTQSVLQTSFQRLSSGYRINSAANDAAGLALSESLRSKIRSFSVAERNASNAMSMAQIADGGLGEISNVIVRMRELAVQGASGDLTSTDRDYIDTEFQALKSEITRLADTNEFNGVELIAGSAVSISFQVGINTSSSDQISAGFGGTTLSSLGLSSSAVSGSTGTSATSAITAIDAALTQVSTERAGHGALLNRLSTAISASQTMRGNLSAANSAIRDVDVAEETSVLARSQVLLEAGVFILSQANHQPRLALSLML